MQDDCDYLDNNANAILVLFLNGLIGISAGRNKKESFRISSECA